MSKNLSYFSYFTANTQPFTEYIMPRRNKSQILQPSSKDDKKVCCFCNLPDDNEVEFGKFHEYQGIVTHYYCLVINQFNLRSVELEAFPSNSLFIIFYFWTYNDFSKSNVITLLFHFIWNTQILYCCNNVFIFSILQLLSSNMEQKGSDDQGILGFLADDILKEIRRGKRLVR